LFAAAAAQVRQGIEAQLRNPLHRYHSRVRLINYDSCYFFDPITLEELDKVRGAAKSIHAFVVCSSRLVVVCLWLRQQQQQQQ
jgi:hypothetical protein